MSLRSLAALIGVSLILLTAVPIGVAQAQDQTTTAKKKKSSKSAPKDSGGQSGGAPGERGTGSY